MARDRLRSWPTNKLLDEAAALLIELHDPFPSDTDQRLRMRRWLVITKILQRRLDATTEAVEHDLRCVCEECWADRGYDPLLDL